MRSIVLFAGLMAALALGGPAGCKHQAPATARELAADLRVYMGELKRWEPTETEVFEALTDVERTYYVDDDFVIRRFKAALPKVHHHVEELRTFRPQTRDLQTVHDTYVAGWEEMGDGFQAVIAAMEAKDYVRLASAKNQVEAGRKKLMASFQELDVLIAETEPELKRMRRQEATTPS